MTFSPLSPLSPSPLSRAAARHALLARAGWDDAEGRPLAGDASFRRYDRLTRPDGTTAILMDAPPPHEDTRPFTQLALHLVQLGYSAPRILAADPEAGFLLLEDLGDATYTRLFAAGTPEAPLYTLAVDTLIDLHRRDPAQAVPQGLAPYDTASLHREARLFVEWFLPAAGISTSPEAVAAFDALWPDLAATACAVPATLVLRDFHVDNLLYLPDRTGIAACGLLDFQDARQGPAPYDLMSLLEDARRDIDPALIAHLRKRYLDAFPGLDPTAFAASWAVLAAQRHLKVIGIFTRLDRRDGKPTYLGHLPRLWRLLDAALEHPALAPLTDWLNRHGPAPEQRLIQPLSVRG